MKVLLGIGLWCFRQLPTGLAIGLGRVLGWLLYHVVRFRRNVVGPQMAMAFGGELSKGELKDLERRHYRHLGLLGMELLRLPRSSDSTLEDRLIYHNLELLDKALARGKGVLLLGGHIGNWEMCGIAISHKGYKMKAIGKEMKSQVGETLKTMIRDENGVPTIPRRNSMKQILTTLKKNESVVMFIDQNMTIEEGLFVDFFGQPACTMQAMAIVAQRTGATVISAWTTRDPDDYHHHCYFGEIVELEEISEDKDENLRHNTARFSACLEKIIRLDPPQWLWIHKRWKTRPPDEVERPVNY